MVTMLIYDRIQEELQRFYQEVKSQIPYISEEKWEIERIDRLQNASGYMRAHTLLDAAFTEVTQEEGLALIQDLRKKYQGMQLLLIADATISPMSYMKPTIMASSLLLRPYTKEDMVRTVREFLCAFVEHFEQTNTDNCFVIDSKDGRIHIDYNQICYFEAREKKVFVQTVSEEYSFYGTIEKLEENLPGFFVRCHRSFIVNTRKIERVLLSQSLILLTAQMDVPLSRTYKAQLKELGRR